MTRNTKLMIAVVAVLTLLVPVAAAMAQATKVTEEATLEVIKVIGKQAGISVTSTMATGRISVISILFTKPTWRLRWRYRRSIYLIIQKPYSAVPACCHP